MIMQILIFLLQFCGLLVTWYFVTNHNKQDFVFLVLGLILASQSAVYFGSVLIVQMRHFFALMIILSIVFRYKLLRNNLGAMSKIYMLLILLIFIASAWSQYPKDFFILKFHRTIYSVLMIFLAGTFRDESDIRKFLWMLFPNLVLLAVGLTFGLREFSGGMDRLMINEQNSNGVGAFAAYLVLGSVMILVFLKTNVVVKIVIGVSALGGISALLSSGSRTAFASCVGAVLVTSITLMSSKKRFFMSGVPVLVCIAYGGIRIWSNVSISVTERLLMIATGGTSGRDIVWEQGIAYLQQRDLWQGMGGIVQGFFVQRADLLEGSKVGWGSTLNIYIDAILETGIMGLTLWVLLLVIFLYRSFRLWRDEKSIYKFAPIAMCLFGLLQGVGESMSMNSEMPIGMFMLIGIVTLSARHFQWGERIDGQRFPVRYDIPYGYRVF